MQTLTLPVLATLAAICAAAAGVYLTRSPRVSKILVPVSGGFLLLVAIFGLIPELISDIGWLRALPLVALGSGLLVLLDRFAFPVCASCDHQAHLRGIAGPLLIATAIHAFVDGWGLVAVQAFAPKAGQIIAVAILIHKIPEGLALGSITGMPGWCIAVELSTLAGAATGFWLTPEAWVSYPLAIAAGTFLFLRVQALRTAYPTP